MPESIVLNQDCLAYMKTLPDNYFDIAVCDPPYGDASLSDDVEVAVREREREKRWNRFGQRFDRYKHDSLSASTVETDGTSTSTDRYFQNRGGVLNDQSNEQAEHGLKSTGKKS